MTDPSVLGVGALSEELRQGTVSAHELTEAYLDRIERHDPGLNCFITVTAQEALAQAAQSDARRRSGETRSPIDGIPIALKDNIDVAGVPTTNGLATGRMATEDSEVVRRLREAGAVFLGKVNMHEGALGATTDNPHHGRTYNPWRFGFTPGGSSGGSGAAVAARLCAAAIGTDTMGSVRIPAAYCGVSGLLPTTGLVSRYGVAPLSETLDHVGPICRKVADLADFTTVMGGFDSRDVLSRPVPTGWTVRSERQPVLEGLRVGVLNVATLGDCQPAVAEVWARALVCLEESGVVLTAVDATGRDRSADRRAGLLLCEAEAAVALREDLRHQPERFSNGFRALLDYGASASAPRLVKAIRTLREVGQSLRTVLGEHRFILSPTTAETSFAFGSAVPAHQADLTAPANFAGCPAVCLPCGLTSDGLPVGLQILAAPFQEAGLLALASALEEVLAFRHLEADVFG